MKAIAETALATLMAVDMQKHKLLFPAEAMMGSDNYFHLGR